MMAFGFPGGFGMPVGVALHPAIRISCSHPYGCSRSRNAGYLHCSRECAVDHKQIDEQGFSSLFIKRLGDWVRVPAGHYVTPPMAVPVIGGGPGFVVANESHVPRGYRFVPPNVVAGLPAAHGGHHGGAGHGGGGHHHGGAGRGGGHHFGGAGHGGGHHLCGGGGHHHGGGGHIAAVGVPAAAKCLRPGCPQFARHGSPFCSGDCRSITTICNHRGCGRVAVTGSYQCSRHFSPADIDPRVALVGGQYIDPFSDYS